MKIPDRLRELTKRENKNLLGHLAYLMQEVGETATEISCFYGQKATNDKLSVTETKIVEETMDSIIVAMAILSEIGHTDEKELERIMQKKLAKWEASLDSRGK
jgi:NTP pyrophosphatase (non-canonical NTP hydrolase)